MSDTFKFTGTIVRVEPDGFGIVRFNEPLGSNTHGIFSGSVGSTVPYGPALKVGTHVAGTAEVDQHSLAAVKTLSITLS